MKLKKVKLNIKLIKNYYYNNNEINLLLYKSLYNNNKLCFFLKTYLYYKYIINFKCSKIKFGCFLTHRMRSKYRFFNISRIKIRDLASFKLISGVRKASW